MYLPSGAPATTRMVRSQSHIPLPGGRSIGEVLADGACCTDLATGGAPGYSGSYQEATQVDTTILGLTPPFHVDVVVP